MTRTTAIIATQHGVHSLLMGVTPAEAQIAQLVAPIRDTLRDVPYNSRQHQIILALLEVVGEYTGVRTDSPIITRMDSRDIPIDPKLQIEYLGKVMQCAKEVPFNFSTAVDALSFLVNDPRTNPEAKESLDRTVKSWTAYNTNILGNTQTAATKPAVKAASRTRKEKAKSWFDARLLNANRHRRRPGR